MSATLEFERYAAIYPVPTSRHNKIFLPLRSPRPRPLTGRLSLFPVPYSLFP
jgi:hypothetical protein